MSEKFRQNFRYSEQTIYHGKLHTMRLYGAVQSEHRRGMECSGFPAGIRGRSFSDDERIFLKTYNVYGIYMNIGWSEHL